MLKLMAIGFVSMSADCKRPAEAVVMSVASMHEPSITGIDQVGIACFTRGSWKRHTPNCHSDFALMLHRWNGDPATTARVVPRHTQGVSSRSVGGEEADGEEDLSCDPLLSGGPRAQRLPSLSLSAQSHTPVKEPVLGEANISMANVPASSQSPLNITFPHNMMATCLQLLQAQSQQAAQKLEYMRKREEREERESRQRRDADRVREEREAAEWEFKKQSADVTQKSKLATEVLANPGVDPSVKQAAGEYLKRLFTTD